ncbi:MAG: electron transfer flavoprotein subunit beta/FixA family protein [Thermoprotei archaeon]|nr:electron transfer flavoprotein subunit beta/FixA family protein [Thermoprotei archaeon]
MGRDIAVLVKASLNPEVVRQGAEGAYDIDYTPLKISDVDRNALEEAARLKSILGGRVYSITVLTWGPSKARDKDLKLAVQEALAKVADEAYVVVDDSIIPGDPIVTSNVIVGVLKSRGLKPALILAGEASVDESTSQVPGRVAAKLGYSYVGYVRRILEVRENSVVVERDVEEYVETLEAPLPAVLSVTQEINEPRPPTLIQIRMASKKPLHVLSLAGIGLNVKPKRLIKEMRVVTVFRKQVVLEEANLEKAAEKLIEYLDKEGVLRI